MVQDVSRLVDLCRQSIIFEDIIDIAACLRAIGNDPDVRIVRIKNRLDPVYHASASAGYRDVVLNIRINNDQTAAMGIHGHVCEVQLLPRLIAELKVSQPCTTTYFLPILKLSKRRHVWDALTQ